jgi:hypothetical protein
MAGANSLAIEAAAIESLAIEITARKLGFSRLCERDPLEN